MSLFIKAAFLLLSIAYPFLVYWGLSQGLHTALLVVLVALLGSRIYMAKEAQERLVVVALTVSVLMIAWFSGYEKGLKLYPVMISFSFLALFGFSLLTEMPIVERIARMREPVLPLHAVKYTRQVTQAWCIFFAINGSISLLTVFANNERIWVLYNGLISYLFMGMMMLGEWIIRRRVRRQDV